MPDRDLRREIVHELQDGVDESTVVEKYNLSEGELEELVNELFDESFSTKDDLESEEPRLRSLEAEEIISDIRAGMSEAELMKKYGLSAGALAKAVRLLLDGDHLNRVDLAQGAVPYEEVVDPGKSRIVERFYLDFDLPVVVAEGPKEVGRVTDLTTLGLGTEGIRVSVGDVRTLRIEHERFVLLRPFSFVAQCRWTRQRHSTGGLIAGFRIISISDEDRDQLRKLVRLLRFYVVSTANLPVTDPEATK